MNKVTISVDGVTYDVPPETDVESLKSRLQEALERGSTVTIEQMLGGVLLINGRNASSVSLRVEPQQTGGPPSM